MIVKERPLDHTCILPHTYAVKRTFDVEFYVKPMVIIQLSPDEDRSSHPPQRSRAPTALGLE
jgi:hypothetical protein